MHDIRRTCLTTMYDRGIKLKQLQYFAGHSTQEQTLDYIRRKNDVEIDEWLIDDRDLLNSETEETASTPIIPFCAVGDNGDRFKNKKQAVKPYFKGLLGHPETVDRGIEHEMFPENNKNMRFLRFSGLPVTDS